jgi:hypothetical protein
MHILLRSRRRDRAPRAFSLVVNAETAEKSVPISDERSSA